MFLDAFPRQLQLIWILPSNDMGSLCSQVNFVLSSVTCVQGTCPWEGLSTVVGVLGKRRRVDFTHVCQAIWG
jgi:hypothetical protein